ncbi:cupin domain-containing protein [Permianibacter aggregans]|uniref:cupin domain-containing protein n=1 Tax=Permianibacter aggregans TaxID=1510150 RepID=UPI0012F92333|nr:cupin domain-containing protein [Permianibacter aggregans]
MKSPFGEISVETFFRDYWQKKPLLIKNAFPTDLAATTPEELAALAMEEEVDARLVQHDPEKDSWHVDYGPFTKAALRKLPRENYTLLVQAVDYFISEVAALKQSLNMFPQWRFDDVMVSYAVKGGGVGPHLDQYDVFLIQGLGRRRWLVANPDYPSVPNDKVKLLRQIEPFTPSLDVIAEPGDMLYVPPNAPHCGTALEPCLTYSIGFRAPAQADIAARLADYLTEQEMDGVRYADPELQAAMDSAQISAAQMQKVKTLMSALMNDTTALEKSYAALVTQTRFSLTPVAKNWSKDKLIAALRKNKTLVRDDNARFAWFIGQDKAVHLFANGLEIPVSGISAESAQFLSNTTEVNAEAVERFADDLSFPDLLTTLFNAGAFQLAA